MGVALRKKQIKTGGFKYYLDYYDNGERYRKSIDIRVRPEDTTDQKRDKKRTAEAIRAKAEVELASRGIDDVVPSFKKNLSFSKFAEEFIDDYVPKDKNKVKAGYAQFKAYLSKKKISNLSMKQLNSTIIKGFIKHLKESELKGETPLAYYKKVKMIVISAFEQGYIGKNPYHGVKHPKELKKPSKLKVFLTQSELEMLARTMTESFVMRQAFFLACNTGMGYGDIVKMTWRDVDFDLGTVQYRRAKTENLVELPMNDTVRSILMQRQGNDSELVFHDLPSSTAVRKSLKAWAKRAGINKNITFYCGRVTFGTMMGQLTKNPISAAKALGHSSLHYVDRYVNPIKEEIFDAVIGFPSIESA